MDVGIDRDDRSPETASEDDVRAFGTDAGQTEEAATGRGYPPAAVEDCARQSAELLCLLAVESGAKEKLLEAGEGDSGQLFRGVGDGEEPTAHSVGLLVPRPRADEAGDQRAKRGRFRLDGALVDGGVRVGALPRFPGERAKYALDRFSMQHGEILAQNAGGASHPPDFQWD